MNRNKVISSSLENASLPRPRRVSGALIIRVPTQHTLYHRIWSVMPADVSCSPHGFKHACENNEQDSKHNAKMSTCPLSSCFFLLLPVADCRSTKQLELPWRSPALLCRQTSPFCVLQVQASSNNNAHPTGTQRHCLLKYPSRSFAHLLK